MAEDYQEIIKPPPNPILSSIRHSWVRGNPHYDKPRLALAYYENPHEVRSPHVALLVMPKFERDQSGRLKLPIVGTKFHVKNTMHTLHGEVAQPWTFEEIDFTNLDAENGLLVCVVIGKVLHPKRIPDMLAAVPVYQDHMYRFSSRIWAQQAIELLLAAGVTRGIYAKTALGGADSYLREKRTEGRWSAQYGGRRVWPSPTVPILDMTTGHQERL
ncbi:hypothetical protein N7492_004647 [Penicillium capsulatum]|uniref:Uncharacterized protein n=1 Tax=Penicillium capsulatum TaxID=69766 RepID=A0A9W9IA89_9EURO|nr:hypothetical protein N7492_004647 [Penicillium capsulatum]KAJ6136240.1 hypothetical protein N7512_001400 [Penicillium capsulatum]